MPAWLPWLGLGVLGAGGLGVVLWALLADRARHRRCLGCRYDMTGVPGQRCPECGREHGAERDLFRTRRRWRPAAAGMVVVLVALGGGLSWHTAHRPGGWWSLAPTEMLLSRVDRLGASGPRRAVAARIDTEPVVAHDALTEEQWRRLAGLCQRMLADPDQSREGRRWAAVMLGRVIPDTGLVDPLLAELLTNGDDESAAWAMVGVYPYYIFRGRLSWTLFESMADLAVDDTRPRAARSAVSVLGRLHPLPEEAISHIAESLGETDDHEARWQALADALADGFSPLEDRIRFLESLLEHESELVRARAREALGALEASGGR